jgi:hypothetical protein
MKKRRLFSGTLHMVRPTFAMFLVAAAVAPLFVLTHGTVARDTKPKGVANSGPTRAFMFGMQAAGSYSVIKNGSDLTEVVVGPSRVLSFSDDVSSGDIYQIMLTGENPVPPSDPTGFAVSGGDDGCATLAWDTPDPGEYVFEYEVAWGQSPGQLTESMTVSVSSVVSQGGTSSFHHCGLPDGTYCYAIRAHNGFDLWSGNSEVSCADVSNGNTQGPPPPQGVAVDESSFGCADVTWNAVSDPSVSGYVVYYADQPVVGGQGNAWDDSVDAGDQTGVEICGFSAGTWYFAVKAYTGGGVYSAYSAEKSITMTGVDQTAPSVVDMSPADGATGVATNSSVTFVVRDAQSGVDVNSITVTFNGDQQGRFSTLGPSSEIMVVAGLDEDFSENSTVTVQVTVSDLASPPNEGSASWSFETGAEAIQDGEAPVFADLFPEDGSNRAESNTEIRVRVTDAGLGVDIGVLEFYVNDSPVTFDWEGDANDLTLIYANEDGFSAGEQVSVRVEACDLASPANCATLSDYSFTVKSSFANLSQGDMGEIVPNGFWADDPGRPLEVRDMPVMWTVRIFDTAGREVRTYTNDQGDGQDWLWDFQNDHGQRVARAMYLVRVTDADGNVRQSGRFLVQTDP